MPREALGSAQLAEVEEALAEVATAAREAEKPSAVNRALHGVNGVVGDLAEFARSGASDSVKAWVAAATTVLPSQIAGL